MPLYANAAESVADRARDPVTDKGRPYMRHVLYLATVMGAVLSCVNGRGISSAEPQGASRVPAASILAPAFERASQGPEEYAKVREELLAVPSDEVVPELLHALRYGPDPLNAELRALAYSVLAHHQRASGSAGLEQLLKGLDDPTPAIQRICCSALDSDLMRAQVEQARLELLRPSARDQDKEVVLKKIGGWGPFAGELYSTVREFFSDPTQVERVRWSAVRAILEMGGLARAMPDLDVVDPVGQKVVMWDLPRYLAESKDEMLEARAEDKPQLPKAQQLLLKAMRSRSAETRRAAFEGAPTVLGWDMVVKDESGKDIINPEYEAALGEMAATDPDKDLRAAAREAASRLEERVESVLRKRAKLERRRQQDGSNATGP